MNQETVFVAPPSRKANLSKILIEDAKKSSISFISSSSSTSTVAEHSTTQNRGAQCTVCYMKMKSPYSRWRNLMHDAQLGDTACNDQDEAEERDVIHHELCQFLSDASWTLVDKLPSARSVFLARLQCTKVWRLSALARGFLPFLLLFLPLPRDFASLRSVDV